MTYRTWDQLTELEQAASTYSDAHKDAYGYRDRSDRSHWTLADYDKAIERCIVVMNEEMENERQLCLTRQRDYEQGIQDMMDLGASDRPAAIRWWFEAQGAEPEWFSNPRYHTQELEHVIYGVLPIPLWKFVLPEVIPGYSG